MLSPLLFWRMGLVFPLLLWRIGVGVPFSPLEDGGFCCISVLLVFHVYFYSVVCCCFCLSKNNKKLDMLSIAGKLSPPLEDGVWFSCSFGGWRSVFPLLLWRMGVWIPFPLLKAWDGYLCLYKVVLFSNKLGWTSLLLQSYIPKGFLIREFTEVKIMPITK